MIVGHVRCWKRRMGMGLWVFRVVGRIVLAMSLCLVRVDWPAKTLMDGHDGDKVMPASRLGVIQSPGFPR